MKEKDVEIIVGLDIGTTKICAIVGKISEYGKIDILGKGQTVPGDAVMRGQVVNIARTVEAIKVAIAEASEKSRVVIKTVVVGIAGQHIKSLQNRGQITRHNGEESISQKDIDRLDADIRKVVLDPGDEIIHILPQDYIVDNERGIKDPVGMPGVRLEGNFHIITGNATAIKNIKKCVEMAGLKVAGLVLEPVASCESVLNDEEKEAGVCLIDIGGGTTDIAIFSDGLLRHTAVVPLGGEIITKDIKEGCNVMYKQANQMKLKFGSALPNETKDNEIISIPGIKGREPKEISVRNLSRIINARVREIFEHVYYEIKASGLEKKLQGGIVLTGGGSQLKHLPQLVEYITGLDTRIGYPTEHLANGLIPEVKSPMYATCIGLMLMGYNHKQSDNSPEEVVSEVPLTEPVDEVVTIPENIEKTPEKEGSIFKSLITKATKFFEKDQDDFQS
jgi:cell division protein FtsA